MKFMEESDTSRCLNEKPNPCSCPAELWCSVSSWACTPLENLPMWIKGWVLSLPRRLSASGAWQLLQDWLASLTAVGPGCQAQAQKTCSGAGFMEAVCWVFRLLHCLQVLCTVKQMLQCRLLSIT